MRHTTLLIVLLCTACAPAAPLPVLDAVATANVSVARVTQTAQQQSVNATGTQARLNATAAASETRMARTALAQETNIARTETMQSIAIAQTQQTDAQRLTATAAAQSTAIARTQVAEITAIYRADIATDQWLEREQAQAEVDRQRAQEWDVFWQNTAQLVIAVVVAVILGVFVFIVMVWLWTRWRRWRVIETNAGTVYLNSSPVIIENQARLVSAPKPGSPVSEAGTSEDVPLNVNGALRAMLKRNPKPIPMDVLELLRDANRYAHTHSDWNPRRIPGHRALGWKSSSRWTNAINRLRSRDFVVNDTDGGVFVAEPIGDIADLLDAIGNRRITL